MQNGIPTINPDRFWGELELHKKTTDKSIDRLHLRLDEHDKKLEGNLTTKNLWQAVGVVIFGFTLATGAITLFVDNRISQELRPIAEKIVKIEAVQEAQKTIDTIQRGDK